MRKSSLGRRSSTHIPVRVPSFGGSASRTCSAKKSTGTLLKPGFSQGRRSQSADRESFGNFGSRQLQRANTIGAMTPKTPRHSSLHGGLPTGSARGPQSQVRDSVKRMSSIGGGKRKDNRPLGEKQFQQTAQAEVEEYFNLYASDVIGPGNSIKPMTTKLFVDLMNHLLQNLDSRIEISKSNYLEELPPLLKKLGYRSKVDRSWLITVNTMHSWQHVIGVLSWLVDLTLIMSNTDPFEMMYPNVVDDQTEENEDESEDDIAIDREMVIHLKKSYQMRKTDEERLATMDKAFFEKQIIDLKCTEEDIDTLQRENDHVRGDVEIETQRRNLLSEELQKHQDMHKAAMDDCESLEEYIKKSKSFVENIEVKLGTTDKEISIKKIALEKKKEEFLRIKDKISNQQISRDEIEMFNAEKNNLQRMIKFYENTIREYQNSAFSVEIKLAEDQKKLEKLVLEYNKLVAEKVVLEPQLKNCEIELHLLTDIMTLQTIDSNLKALKEEYKNELVKLESKKEECENILKRAYEEMDVAKEETSKETVLLERIESDYDKHKELVAKETEKLKKSLSRYQKESNDLSSELTQFDPAKLAEKKQKLKMLEHDYQLVQQRSKEFLEGVLEILKEEVAAITPAFTKFMETVEKIENKVYEENED